MGCPEGHGISDRWHPPRHARRGPQQNLPGKMNACLEPRSAVRRESAEFHILKKILLARPETTCGEAVALLRQHPLDYADAAVVTDSQRRVLGMISTGKLVTQDPNTQLHRVMQRDVPIATLDTDQERVASLALDSVLGAVPVVDGNGCFVGLITPQALLSVLRREHVEDLHRLTGILIETNAARAAIEGSPLRRARLRLPWLFVGLAGSALAAIIMAQYQTVLKARVEIAFFLPGVVYLADAIGTQTEAIAVRGLSLSHLNIRQLLGRELWTGETWVRAWVLSPRWRYGRFCRIYLWRLQLAWRCSHLAPSQPPLAWCCHGCSIALDLIPPMAVGRLARLHRMC
jgi:magnesium transporter